MEYFGIITFALIVTALITGVVIHLRKKAKPLSRRLDVASIEQTEATDAKALITLSDTQKNEIMIPIELLPAATQFDEKGLTEITDRTVVARISSMLPATVSSVAGRLVSTSANAVISSANTAVNAAFKSANDVFKNGNIYKVIIPAGAKLSQSTQMENAVRGMYHGTGGIRGHANLVKVDAPQLAQAAPTNLSNAATIASTAANVMNVASLVVGQYYMAVISSKLDSMTKRLDKISDFQDREFRSRILSLIAHVGKISQFSTEILEDDDQRIRKLSTLDDLEASATELLGQVNITIEDIAQKRPNPDYKNYQSLVEQLSIQREYQNVLVAVLAEISNLTYLLGKSSISTEQSYATYKMYLERSIQTKTFLGQWHERQLNSLGINLDKLLIRKKKIESLFTLGWLVDKLKYKGINPSLAQEIRVQTSPMISKSDAPKPVYDENVEIIIRDGKYYFLPESSAEK